MTQLNVGIIGFGTVGAGTYEVLTQNRAVIEERAGIPIRVKKIADLDLESERGVAVDRALLTTEVGEILEDPEIHVVVELIGGLTAAREYILQALQRGKHVVTANKALLAEHGREIFAAAERHGVNLAFEGSVCGGIPVVGALKRGLSANRIIAMMGILNGTSNYILTRMAREGLSYDQVVAEAVKLGIAEDPPTLDVSGADAAHKLAILISLAFGTPVPFEDIYQEGIDTLHPSDIRFASDLGYRIKLLAVARQVGAQVEARVHPAMIPEGHILANVNGVFNAIHIDGDFVGPNLYYGLGAGRRPTGSAVAADIVEMARRMRLGIQAPDPPLGHARAPQKAVQIQPMKELVTSYYFRFSALDRPGVLSRIAGILGEHEISIASVIQKGRELNGPVPIVMLTHEAREENVARAISLIDQLDVIPDETVILRVEKGDPDGRSE